MPEGRASLAAGMHVTKAVSLLRPLGAGGMGAVWLADHQGLKTQVVVKFMLGGLDSSESARMRFSREAAAAAQVKSPHVVQMLDHGLTDDGTPFIVMEHLEGHDLGDEIKKNGALDPARVVVIVSQIAKALAKVHAAGLLHRDIKPDNIFVCTGEEDLFVKLLDFGIAKSSTADKSEITLDGETKTGQVVGTPFYMSPEQVTAQKQIDHRADLWSLGVVAFEALTGQRPYDGPSFGALAVRIATGPSPKPSAVNPSLPRAVDDWFAKACAREARDRFASARELAEAFRAAFDGVVSLPASAINSDSGQRSPSAPEQTPALGLATTALDPPSPRPEKDALARSEAGVAVGGAAAPRSSPVRVAAPIALGLLAAGALGWTMKGQTRTSAAPPPSVAIVRTAAADRAGPKAPAKSAPPIESATPAEPAKVASAAPVGVADAGVKKPVPPRPPDAPHSAAHPIAAPKPSADPKPNPANADPDLF